MFTRPNYFKWVIVFFFTSWLHISMKHFLVYFADLGIFAHGGGGAVPFEFSAKETLSVYRIAIYLETLVIRDRRVGHPWSSLHTCTNVPHFIKKSTGPLLEHLQQKWDSAKNESKQKMNIFFWKMCFISKRISSLLLLKYSKLNNIP